VKALVRGAAGFVGFHMAKTLQEMGVEVRALIRAGSDTSDLGRLDVELCTGDIRDYDSARREMDGCSEPGGTANRSGKSYGKIDQLVL
jgi:dihydroflavonol-4-reductase